MWPRKAARSVEPGPQGSGHGDTPHHLDLLGQQSLPAPSYPLARSAVPMRRHDQPHWFMIRYDVLAAVGEQGGPVADRAALR